MLPCDQRNMADDMRDKIERFYYEQLTELHDNRENREYQEKLRKMAKKEYGATSPTTDFIHSVRQTVENLVGAGIRRRGSGADAQPKHSIRQIVTSNKVRSRRTNHMEMNPRSNAAYGNAGGGVRAKHKFLLDKAQRPTWCDQCGDFIWGIRKQCLRCWHCGYTCHHKCQKSVTLECSGGATSFPPEEETALHDPPDDHEHMSALHNDLCETDSGYSGSGGKGERTLTKEDLQRSIWQFNERFPNLGMTMPDSQNTFHGFVHVNMNLSRPINMRVSPRPPSIYDVLQHELSEEDFKTKILSFYLPKDTLKALHISSKTTAQEVIEVLLNKFKITDNPRKFALYEQTLEKNAEIRLRKILDSEHPLVLCLNWGNEMSGKKRFVLQENETGEIMWEAFSVPELQNFLKILELEENEVLKELKNKYIVQRKHMQEIMKEHEEKRQNKERT